MSRIGKLPITIPAGVTAELNGNMMKVKGAKSELKLNVPQGVNVEIKDGKIVVTRQSDEKLHKSLHGTIRNLIFNMIQGVTTGYKKKLEINGVGYRVQLQGKKAIFSLGFSHPIEFTPPEGISLAVDEEKKNLLIISGADKQMVGEVAAKIRSFRKPEPYKGKGIKYEDEHIVRKAGKAAAGSKEK
jgi:large subunit ribosomal protein L6